ncbi:MAG: sulfatase [Lunatimonas sp.]|uniref:sulfatase n=1 Tax=Lunatimonas sp. TaxID=2060141 RepID=UPI00263B9A1B|nr:sulfatase [Lunatimonas sp.]MCC5936132.1 sulfatase [Lunatimonas sp.]
MKKLCLFGRCMLVLCMLLYLPSCKFSTEQAGKKPNILFIAMDDLNDWAGFLEGHAGMKIHTPNLDRLAGRSMIFTNAHTPAPACAPTRAAILTGVHHARSGVQNVHWGDGPMWREFDALKDVVTLEQFFKNNGYKTLGAGKIYHSQAPPWTPTSQVEPANWDFYYPSAYISHPYQIRAPEDVIYPEDVDNENRPGGNGWWTWGAIPVPDEKMADFHVVDWASYQLRQEHSNPFFLAVGTWKPHDPWEVPQKYFDLYPLEEVVLPERKADDLADAFDHGRRWIMDWVLENDQWEKIIQSYAASITFSDAMIGRLLDTLENSEYADNTIVVLWSDHGMHMGEKDNIEKFTLWERSTRVPLLISLPGMAHAGQRCEQPVSLMDMYPTLVELAGFELPSHLDGSSLVPQIKDPTTETSPVISSYRFASPRQPDVSGHAVRSMRYRYIYYPEINLEELYDHAEDPNEWHNIAYKKDQRQVIEAHRKILLEMVPNLSWKEGDPEGYSVDANGFVKKNDFKTL